MLPVGGGHSTEVAFELLTQQPRVQFSAFLKIISEELFLLDAAEINQRHFFECGKACTIR